MAKDLIALPRKQRLLMRTIADTNGYRLPLGNYSRLGIHHGRPWKLGQIHAVGAGDA